MKDDKGIKGNIQEHKSTIIVPIAVTISHEIPFIETNFGKVLIPKYL